jgi:hypothetical protein
LFRKRFPIAGVPEPRCFWEIDTNMCIRINSISNVEVDEVQRQLYLIIVVSIGRHILEQRKSELISPSNPRWRIEDVSIFACMSN